jgi:hypothetical protein
MPSGACAGTASSTCLIAAGACTNDRMGRQSDGSSSVFSAPPERRSGPAPA